MERHAPNSIATFLREIREDAGVSLRSRAKEVGLNPGYLSRLESGDITAGPTAVGRMLVALTDREAQELLRRYFQDAAAMIAHERARVIRESDLTSDRRKLTIGIKATYANAEKKQRRLKRPRPGH